MIRRKKTERRQYPRIKEQLPLKIVTNGYDFITNTKDLSCVGAYCQVGKYIPPFTKIIAKLTLPLKNNTCDVECKGVVVRTDDEKNGGFNIAVFFNEIKNNHRQKITQYINQFLPQNSFPRP